VSGGASDATGPVGPGRQRSREQVRTPAIPIKFDAFGRKAKGWIIYSNINSFPLHLFENV
jgi:hypothetical protein